MLKSRESQNNMSGMEGFVCVKWMSHENERSNEIAPMSFVRKFPKDWKQKGWDKNYLHNVFWSPEDNDSPIEFLKRESTIPFFEMGTPTRLPGYYRALVLAAAGKRLSHICQCFN